MGGLAVAGRMDLDLHGLRDCAHIVYARPECVLSQVPRAALLDVLSEAERAKQARFLAPEDAELYLVAHALTRCLLARYLGLAPRALAFQAGARGRPELDGPAADSGVRFNLSHTRGLAACGVSLHAAIGVDVEHTTRKVELLRVGKRVFSPRERAGLAELTGAAQRRRFFELWTLKEAYVKATGKGLASPLQGVTFEAQGDDPVVVSFEDPADGSEEAWCMRRHELPPQHRLAVALHAGRAARVRWEEADFPSLLVS